ncbi:MAG: hypothetical protein WKF30_06720 [Pyrinomonadaceae bacterium]
MKRQREQRLRETLRQIRSAIDEFQRDTVAMQCSGAAGAAAVPNQVVANPGQPVGPGTGAAAGGQPQQPGVNPQAIVIDPRSKVMISDCTIFTVDNPDRYPPDLDSLTSGVSVTARGGNVPIGGGLNGSDPLKNSLDLTNGVDKKKVYLRALPVDPMTGKPEWDLRSCYDPPDATSWGGENVFDVRSKSEATALNGEKYSEW